MRLPLWIALLLLSLCASSCASFAYRHPVAAIDPPRPAVEDSDSADDDDDYHPEDHPELRPRLTSTSPYALAAHVNVDTARRARAGSRTDDELLRFWREIEIDPGSFGAGDLRAEVSKAWLGAGPGAMRIVKLTRSFDDCRYVIFDPARRARGGARWRVVGVIDHEFNRYVMSTHRVATTGGRPFLVVRGQTGSGTGFSSYDDVWYVLEKDGLRRVLDYEAEGHEAPWPCGLGRELSSTIRPTGRHSRVPTCAVELRETLSVPDFGLDRYVPVTTIVATARYTWDERSKWFFYDAHASRMSESDRDDVFNVSWDSAGARAFLAKSRDARVRRALRRIARFDATCDDEMKALSKRRASRAP